MAAILDKGRGCWISVVRRPLSQVWFNLVNLCQRRRFVCEKQVTKEYEDSKGCQVMSIGHMPSDQGR